MIDVFYAGWRESDRVRIVRFGPNLTEDLPSKCDGEGIGGAVRPDWGQQGWPAVSLAHLLLWDATWDQGVMDDLAEMYAWEVTSRLDDSWRLCREDVRQWVQDHQFYRVMMHQKRLRECPGCG